MHSNFHDYNVHIKRDIHVQQIYVKPVFFPIFSTFQWQPFSLFYTQIYQQICIILDFLIICNIYYVLCKQPVYTSLIEAVQFLLQPLLSILNSHFSHVTLHQIPQLA